MLLDRPEGASLDEDFGLGCLLGASGVGGVDADALSAGLSVGLAMEGDGVPRVVGVSMANGVLG